MRLVLAAVLLALPASSSSTPAAWPQWGGPNRNFVVLAADLAPSWPDGGPKRLWQKALGDGFSAMVTDGVTLYATYREGAEDVAIALDARTGETRWMTKYAAPFTETCSERLGAAPRAAPLIHRDQLITVTSGGELHSFDRRDGKAQWTVDLLAGAAAELRACGYSTSPVAYKNTLITMAGGKGRAVVALDAATGRTVWQSQDFQNGYSSPILIDLDGHPEVVAFTYAEVAGLNPDTGALEWSKAHPSDQGVNVATPIWGDDHLLFVSSAYGGGSRMLKLARKGDAVAVEEVWATQRVRVHFGNAVRMGNRIYFSNGDMATAPFAAVDVATGEPVWRDRSVTRATLIGVGKDLILLDEDGNLVLASPTESGLEVRGKVALLAERAWTAPTLSGTTLLVRDRHQVIALDLGR